MIITLTNDFHGSRVNVRVPGLPTTLSTGQTQRVYRELCGVEGCTCGGLRGPQSHDGFRLVADVTWESGPSAGQASPRIEIWADKS